MKQEKPAPGAEQENPAGAQPPAAENGGGVPPVGGNAPPPPEAEGQGGSGTPPPSGPQQEAPGTKAAVIRHKTQYPKYRCAGLVLTQRPETYHVTDAQLEKLNRDPWVVIGGAAEKEPGQK
jgi:hypothetical protein